VGATGFSIVRPAAVIQFAQRKPAESHTMPQDNPRTESQRAEHLGSENARSERSRSAKSARPGAMESPFGEMGARSVNAGLRMQKEMLDVFEEIGRDWYGRATSKAELAFKLPNKLTGAGSVPDALSAYQQWLGEWMNMFGEDGRQFITDSQKIMDAGARCFADTPPLGTS
jgi:hypothetical protein